MALKGYREVIETNIEFKMNEVGERGIIVIVDGENAGYVVKPGSPLSGSELPVGLLMDDVQDVDYSTRPMILQKNVVPLDSQVSLAMDGKFKTNMIPSGVTPAAGQRGYLAVNGYISTVVGSGILVGKFLSAKDSDGYALFSVEL